ncbi:MAG: hypothetical protein MHPSP_001144 [Paramarteilia canceri]
MKNGPTSGNHRIDFSATQQTSTLLDQDNLARRQVVEPDALELTKRMLKKTDREQREHDAELNEKRLHEFGLLSNEDKLWGRLPLFAKLIIFISDEDDRNEFDFYQDKNCLCFSYRKHNISHETLFASEKPIYKSSQFKQAFELRNQISRAAKIVNFTQKKYQCCGLFSYKDYYDKDTKISESSERPVPQSCFRQPQNYVKLYKLQNDPEMKELVYMDLSLLTLGPIELYLSRNYLLTQYLISKLVLEKKVSNLDLNAQTVQLLNASLSDSKLLNKKLDSVGFEEDLNYKQMESN